jgi:ribosomal protein S18 acetylase RimI-like enzyme
VTRGCIHQAGELPGFVATSGGSPIGLLTYRIEAGECEIVSLDAIVQGRGVGTLLIDAVRALAVERGLKRTWLITTNDNLSAQRFYESRGFRVAAVHAGAMAESRRLKPEIPETGIDGIHIEDEIEMEMMAVRPTGSSGLRDC